MSRGRLTLVVAVLVVVGLLGWQFWPAGDSGTPDSGAPSSDTEPETPEPTQPPAEPRPGFRVATFNVLGDGHTQPNGNKPEMASGPRRAEWAVRLLERHRIEIAGLQEFEVRQSERFTEVGGDRWAVYPGTELAPNATAQSIAWRDDLWRRVRADVVDVPYFSGNTRPSPYVLLENRATGQRVWVWNTHNPANVRGPAEQARLDGYRLEGELIDRLRMADPDVPVISLGDKNLGGDFFCELGRHVRVHSADGGLITKSGRCRRPPDPVIDWIVATPDVEFSGYTRIEEGLVEKTSDHRFVFATAVLPEG